MRIAVNTRFLLKGKLEGIGWFTNEILKRVVQKHPEHEFIFFFDRPYDQQFIFARNVTPIVLSPPARHPFLWYIWFEWSIRRALTRYKADLFISTDGFLSLSTKIPTLLVVHDLAFEHYPQHLPFKFRYYLQKYTPKFVQKAKHIVTVSTYSKQDLIDTYQVQEDKISIVYNGANELYRPLGYEEKKAVKETYSGGCEYFVFAGALHPRKNIVNLLKAFALFKKKQRTDMKILIIGRFAWNSDEIKETIENHPFKSDVVHLDYMQVEELSKVIGAAYGITFVSLYEGFGIPVLEAIKCHVPGIVSNVTSIPEVAGNTCLYVNPTDVADIAEKMRIFYKDEHLRGQLVLACQEQAQKYDWEKSAFTFYDVLQEKML
ncbi:MAG: glycosyltransferase family 4 protein [Bacteroidetes bacterium]|nr:glycosyltransferase family 4 protein [Bacteroidota bacterium]MBK8145845.1 glycosyltransferase family 4 protein [Bacteroidota bacterium]MBP6315878.1 glycosyltransferase family 4 protein [Chitinophagaceae bacterium]